jgi:hypothetical protein
MGAYLDLNEFVNRCSGGNSGNPEFLDYHKESRVAGAAAGAPVAGKWTSLFLYEGTPSHGAVPTTIAAPDRTTQGAWAQANPSGGRQKWMSFLGAGAAMAGTLVLYDRLLHIGSLDATNIGAQTVGGALTRYTNGLGNQIWAEIYTQIGATGTTITANYTDDAGNTGNVTQPVTFGGTGAREAQRIIPLSLAAGDRGVQAVASATVLATTGTAGNFGITIAHPLAYIGVGLPGLVGVRNFIEGGLLEIATDACLAWAFIANTTTQGMVDAFMFSTER